MHEDVCCNGKQDDYHDDQDYDDDRDDYDDDDDDYDDDDENVNLRSHHDLKGVDNAQGTTHDVDLCEDRQKMTTMRMMMGIGIDGRDNVYEDDDDDDLDYADDDDDDDLD